MRKFDYICSIIIFGILVLFGTSFLILKEKIYSNEEDRMFISKPKISILNMNDTLRIEQLEIYLKEQFIFRNEFLETTSNIERLFGKKEKNGVYYGKFGYLLERPREVKDKALLIKQLNRFYQEHNDLNVTLLLLPSHVTINNDLVKDVLVFNQYQDIKTIYKDIKFNTIDVVPVLKEGNKEYEMYYHLDSNITSYGAYYIYLEYCKRNNIEPLSINDFEIKMVTDSFKGNLVKHTYMFSYKKDNIVTFIPKNESNLIVDYINSDKNDLYHDEALTTNYMYSYFLGSNEPLIKVTNKSNKTKKELLIIKDQSANSMVPFFTNHYNKIHVIDIDYYRLSISDYLTDNKNISDVIFIYEANGLDSAYKNLKLS